MRWFGAAGIFNLDSTDSYSNLLHRSHDRIPTRRYTYLAVRLRQHPLARFSAKAIICCIACIHAMQQQFFRTGRIEHIRPFSIA